MKHWGNDEYCLYVNAREGSDLWSLLADWSDSEDEQEWARHIPRFSQLIRCWQPLGFIKVFRSDKWPALHAGEEVCGQELDELLADPNSWKYAEEPTRWIAVSVGDRDIQELEEGMCDLRDVPSRCFWTGRARSEASVNQRDAARGPGSG